MIEKKEIVSIFEKIVKKKVVQIRKTRLGNSSITYKINSADNSTYYFKQGKNNYKLQSELNELLRENNICSPDVISFTDTWIIQRGIIGERLCIKNKNMARQVLFSLGETLSKLHTLKTSGYGELINTKEGEYKNYIQYYEKTLSLIGDNYKKEIITYINKFHNTCINHGDICPDHIFVDKNGKYSALIDWDDVVSAPIEFDLSELLLHINNNMTLWDSFINGYSKFGKYTQSLLKDILLAELLQATEGLYYHLIETGDNTKIDNVKRNRIKTVEHMIDNL